MKIKYSCSHNEAEYEACILGLKVALSMGVTKASVFGDSLLIFYQTNGTKDDKLIPYLASL
jgi:ribonuclease HI